MGFDLLNANEYFYFNQNEWHRLLILAHYFGWEPMGTVPSEIMTEYYLGGKNSNEEAVQEYIKNWGSHYNYNDFQIVVKEDAINLAHALMNALEGLPNEGNDLEYFSKDPIIDDFSSDEWKNTLNEFILFCKNGEFLIT
jgi:hypothetical protein